MTIIATSLVFYLCSCYNQTIIKSARNFQAYHLILKIPHRLQLLVNRFGSLSYQWHIMWIFFQNAYSFHFNFHILAVTLSIWFFLELFVFYWGGVMVKISVFLYWAWGIPEVWFDKVLYVIQKWKQPYQSCKKSNGFYSSISAVIRLLSIQHFWWCKFAKSSTALFGSILKDPYRSLQDTEVMLGLENSSYRRVDRDCRVLMEQM